MFSPWGDPAPSIPAELPEWPRTQTVPWVLPSPWPHDDGGACPWCQQSPVSLPAPSYRGWLCPKCGVGINPDVAVCPICGPATRTVTSATGTEGSVG